MERTTTTSAELTDSSREASARNMNPPNAAAYATLAAEEGTTPPRASGEYLASPRYVRDEERVVDEDVGGAREVDAEGAEVRLAMDETETASEPAARMVLRFTSRTRMPVVTM